MVKPLREQTTLFRIRIGALAPTEPGRVLFENEFFGIVQSIESVYVGAVGQTSRYLGVRAESQLYLGAGNLWP